MVPAVLAAVAFVALLRGRVRLALYAVVAWVLAGVLRAVIGFPEGTAVAVADMRRYLEHARRGQPGRGVLTRTPSPGVVY